MRIFGMAAALMLFAGSAMAQSSYSYDWQSGNSYNTRTDSLGRTTVQGYNSRNGSQWNTNIDRSGNMKGYDAGGNYWNYNAGSGSYYNYGTGQSCYGKGSYRTCY